MFKWGWFGKLSVQQRAKNEIEAHEKDLYDAERSLALWTHQVDYHRAEIARLAPAAAGDATKGVTN